MVSMLATVILIVLVVYLYVQLEEENLYEIQSIDNRSYSVSKGEWSGVSTDYPENYELIIQVRFEPSVGVMFTQTITTGYHIPTNETFSYYDFTLPEREVVGSEYVRVFWEHKDGKRYYGTVDNANLVENNWYKLVGEYNVYFPVVLRNGK
jgi:hypothetical protein